MHEVPFYFDLISPYASLALLRAADFAEAHEVRWRMRPVAYGAVLSATGLVGPAEIPAKRRYTFQDVARLAALEGIALRGPPAHPFRSLEALRCVALFQDRPEAAALAADLARACWVEGRDLTDVGLLATRVAGVGLPAEDLAARLAAPANKARVKANTAELLEAGGFGVPTFTWRGQLFWGQDRLPHLAAALTGRLRVDLSGIDAILARPRGADRRDRPQP